jgi:hypothetical protein
LVFRLQRAAAAAANEPTRSIIATNIALLVAYNYYRHRSDIFDVGGILFDVDME